MTMKNPCYKCSERNDACHASCEKYKAWSIEEQDRKNLIYKNRSKEIEVLDAPFRAMERAKKERKRK